MSQLFGRPVVHPGGRFYAVLRRSCGSPFDKFIEDQLPALFRQTQRILKAP
jgi:hypothetical protein